MVRMPTFWALWIAYCLGTTAGTMVISQLVPFARNAGHTRGGRRRSRSRSARSAARRAACSPGGCPTTPDALNTLRVMLLVSACAMPLLFLFRENVALFYALLFAVYYCYGTQLSVYASTSADFFGTKNVGFNYGLLLLAWGVAAILGPFLGGRVYVATGEYRYAFFVAAAMSIAALATLSFARSPHVGTASRARRADGTGIGAMGWDARRTYMRRVITTMMFAGALIVGGRGFEAQGDGGYKLVPNWPKLPAGMYFGLKDAPPPPAERDAQAAARRASGRGARRRRRSERERRRSDQSAGHLRPRDRSARSHLRVQPRREAGDGVRHRRQPDSLGRRSGDQRQDDQPVVAALGRRRLGRQRLRHRARRAPHREAESRSSTSSCCSSGTTNEKGNDATHLNLPSGIAILHNGNMIVTDGYGNNRVILFDKTGKFIKQVGKGAGGPADKGTGPGEWNLPHKIAVDANENLYIIDREGHRVEVFDKNLNYIREIRNDWNPWDINISRKGTDGIGWIADHEDERVLKLRPEGRQDPRDVGQAGLGPERVRLGPRHRRRLEGRGVRGRHLRSADSEVRAHRRDAARRTVGTEVTS